MNKKNIGVIAAATVIICAALHYGYNMFYGSAVEKSFTVTLNPNEDYETRIDKVKAHMDYHFAFDFYAKRLKLERSIKSGTFTFEQGMSVVEVARMLKIGTNSAVKLVINNARTPEALAGKVARQLDVDSVTMRNTLRDEQFIHEMGYNSAEEMFSIFIPNTYEVFPNVEPKELVRRMKIESDRFWVSHQAQLEKINLSELEVMILASIVHEETSAVDEMPRIAGVYMNRLNSGMLLQADPTVKYALGDPTIKRILYKHLEVDSPYNTYKYAGLPPTPIAMPDMAAIEAVLNYEKHDYLYFCARPEMDGRHNFAKTLDEHSRNALAYHKALERLKIK